MNKVIENAVNDLTEIVRSISSTPELPVNSPEDALELDFLLNDILNQLEKIIEDLKSG